MSRRKIVTVATALLALAGLVVGGEVSSPPPPAGAVGATHPTLVSAVPTATTPHVTNGNVRAVAVVGQTVVLGGDFTAATDPDGTVVNRSYLLAFDRATGRIRRDWAPQLNDEVLSLAAAPDGQSVYVGGRFSTVDGVGAKKVARIAMADGRPLAFQSAVSGLVTEVAVSGGRLYIGGVFTTVQGRNRPLFAALNAATGAVDDNVDLGFAGTHRGGEQRIWAVEPSPDGRNVVVVGNFKTVGGQTRDQIVKIDTPAGGRATVNGWSTSRFSGECAPFTDYVRDVSYSPDGSYFVVATTGAFGGGAATRTCDTVTRFEAAPATPNQVETWINFSGSDSFYSVEISGAAVYVGGHFRWTDNPLDNRTAPDRMGIAALDPTSGLPLSWNPGRDRGRAVWEMVATPDGLYVGSDTDRIAQGRYRGRIAFFPLTGGRRVPQPARMALPIRLYQLTPAAGATPARLTYRSYNGTTVGAPVTAAGDLSGLTGARAAWFTDGQLYTAHSDGTLKRRSFDGTAFGPVTTLDLYGAAPRAADLRTMTAGVYDAGKLFFTRAGDELARRWFSTENGHLGNLATRAAGSGSGAAYQNVRGMVLAGDRVLYQTTAGTLRRAAWRGDQGGIDAGSATTISGPGVDSATWGGVLFALPGAGAPPPPGPANKAPHAYFTDTCTGATCTYNGSISVDDDGTIASHAWTFGDGTTGTGSRPSKTYARSGTYAVTLTVTDDRGATNSKTKSVTVTVPTTPPPPPAVRGSFVARAASSGAASARTHQVVAPTSVRAGDQLLLFAASNAPKGTALAAPAGWTRVANADLAGARGSIWARTATATDAGATVRVTVGVSARADLVLTAHRGLRLVSGSPAMVAGYVTPSRTAVAGDWLVAFWADKSATTRGWTAPAGVATRWSRAGTGAGHLSELVADRAGLPAGAAGSLRAGVATPVANAMAATILLRPVA